MPAPSCTALPHFVQLFSTFLGCGTQPRTRLRYGSSPLRWLPRPASRQRHSACRGCRESSFRLVTMPSRRCALPLFPSACGRLRVRFGSTLIFSASSLLKPLEAVMGSLLLLVALSFALTFRMPFASMSNVTSICGVPAEPAECHQLERAQRTVVLRELPLALHDGIPRPVWLSEAVE